MIEAIFQINNPNKTDLISVKYLDKPDLFYSIIIFSIFLAKCLGFLSDAAPYMVRVLRCIDREKNVVSNVREVGKQPN